jgi:hypothetical protein
MIKYIGYHQMWLWQCISTVRFEMTDLEKQPKEAAKLIEAGKWLVSSFRPLQDEATSIYNRICPTHGALKIARLNDYFTVFKKALEAVADGSPHASDVFIEAVEKLPKIVERMKALPKSDVREVRKILEFEMNALNAFIEACNLGIFWATVRQLSPLLNSGETDEVIALKVNSSKDWVKLARKEAARNCKPLESAMYIRFAQAYKCWEAASNADSAFFSRLHKTYC